MKRYMLVTDDDPVLLDLYRRMFSPCENLAIDYAQTPQACTDLLTRHSYDVALIDISLGDEAIDGFQLLSLIREQSPQTDVLMMSSMDSEAVVDRCRSLGAATFASKNRDFPRRLRQEVRSLLDHRTTT